jgi:predicted permease
VNDLVRDIRYAFRALLRTPLASGVALLALALGIGVNTSSFITTSALVLHPFSYPHLERILTIWDTEPKLKLDRTPLSAADFVDLRRDSRSFEQLAGYRQWDAALTGMGDPVRVEAARVTPSFFAVLGEKPILGRVFSDAEQAALNPRVAVVSEGFWKTHLGGSRQALGKTIELDNKRYSVIGVMPDDFDLPLQNEIWTPLIFMPADTNNRTTRDVMAIGLLKPGVAGSEAVNEAAAIGGQLARQYPDSDEGHSMTGVLLSQAAGDVTQRFILILLGATLFVLLLACANIGNLQLARAATRQKEIAVRAALGARRMQIARQLLVESLLLSLAAGAVGLLLASWNLDRLKGDISANVLRIVPGLADMRVDSTVVILTLAASLAAGVLCSLPAIFQLVLRGMRRDLSDVLQQRGDSQSALPAQNRVRSGLVILELALALVLLVGAGMMVKTFQRLLDVYQGFDPRNLLTMQVSLPATAYPQDSQLRSFYDRVLASVSHIRGVQAAAISSNAGRADRLLIGGRPEPRPGEPRPQVKAVSAEYLAAMRIPVFNGRSISEFDGASTQPVVVVSESVARHYWPRQNPIGNRIKLSAHSEWLTVVGVCGDIVENWVSDEAAPIAYIPYTQSPGRSALVLIRTPGDPMSLTKTARARIESIDRNLPVYNVVTMEKSRADERGGLQASARAMTMYGVIALILAATGIYAVLSFFVAARTHDIGVHMALGANRADILRMTMWRALVLTGLGMAFGLPMATLLARGMSSALYGVVQVNVGVFWSVTVVLLAAAMLASYLPSWRATQIDPATALRRE